MIATFGGWPNPKALIKPKLLTLNPKPYAFVHAGSSATARRTVGFNPPLPANATAEVRV